MFARLALVPGHAHQMNQPTLNHPGARAWFLRSDLCLLSLFLGLTALSQSHNRLVCYDLI